MAEPAWASWEDPLWGLGAAPANAFDLESYEIDYDNVTALESASELFDYVVQLKQMNVLSAKQSCVLSFWAAGAGAKGMITKLAFKPSSQSGHFSRHFDAVVGCRPTDRDFYELHVPLHSRLDATRNVELLPVVAPHEAFALDICHGLARQRSLRKPSPMMRCRRPTNNMKSYVLHPLAHLYMPSQCTSTASCTPAAILLLVSSYTMCCRGSDILSQHYANLRCVNAGVEVGAAYTQYS